MKKFKIFLVCLFILPCFMFLGGCSLFNDEAYVTNIVKTETIGTTDVYTIHYSDGTTSTINIENGKDGENAILELDALFAECVNLGLYENNSAGYQKFIRDYFAPDEENSTETKLAINKALQSAVSVYSCFPTSKTYQFKSTYAIGAGAGVIYKMDTSVNGYSYVITNFHVVYDTESTTSNNIAKEIFLYQYGVIEEINVEKTSYTGYYTKYEFSDQAVKCEYIGGAMSYDIAILKVKTSDLIKNNPTAKAVTVASSYTVGDAAIAIGNPESEGISATKGIVSVDSEILTMTGADNSTEIDFRVLRMDTSVNGGNSGGGLFNINGELIGIVNAKTVSSSDGTILENYAYALPIDNVHKVADNIIYYNSLNNNVATVKRLTLGITYVAKNGKAIYNENTGEIVVTDEFVVETVSNGLAKDMGIKEGDVITSITINGTKFNITRHYQVGDYLLIVKPNDSFAITVKNSLGTQTWITTVNANDFTTIE